MKGSPMSGRRRRVGGAGRCQGFTAVELLSTLSLLALFLPIFYHFTVGQEEVNALAHWDLEVATELRTIREELQLEARGGRWGPDGVTLTRAAAGEAPGACATAYRVTPEGVLLGDRSAACGGPRALARGVRSITREPGGVTVVFTRALRPEKVFTTAVFIPVEPR